MNPVVLILGLGMTAVTLVLAGRRVWFLGRLITSGQPAPDRVENVTQRLGESLKTQVVEVFGQKKLLKWSVPGAAHFFVFWAFLILSTVYLEAYGALFDARFHIPLVGHWPILGFAQDFIAVMALVGLVVFANIRLKNSPEKLGRKSRFKGSHLGGAWLVLLMIFNVIWSMFLFRGAASAADNLPYKNGAFVSIGVGKLLDGLSAGTLETLEHIGLLLHIGIMLSFLILVLNSKHLHIFLAPLNVLFGRRPAALGAVKPLTSDGKAITLDDIDDLDEDAKLGVGAVEDFTWKGLLDLATCTECGRCQSQCPAWNTEKPLSPKLLIMELRDHAFAKAPYILADESDRDGLSDEVKAEAARPLIGDSSAYGVIDPDVLWSCVTCGACVNECPVDIEHIDHIIDMRRYAVLVESNFPAELNGLFKGLENKGNPWNMSPTARLDWTKGLDFEVKVVGETIESLDEVEWLFWVGCAGAYEDRAKKTTRAVAELLEMAGVSFGVLGNGETCTGDPARRAGNEFVFQGLAQQNVETFKEFKVKKVVSTCAHCFNTLKNEYKDFGVELEVVHHTQLLNRLVREGKLTPVKDGEGASKRSITYHDPCYIGRHNGVYSPPRELLEVLPGAEFVEMERNSEKSFCCGAGGARMWMEENIGARINVTRTVEAVGTGADQIAVACPFCRVMLSDGLTAEQSEGRAREEVEVLDIAQMLLASVKGVVATKRKVGASSPVAAKSATPVEPVATKSEPAEKSGGSLFDVETKDPESTPVEPDDTPAEAKPKDEPEAKAEPKSTPVEPDDTPAEAKAEPVATTDDEPPATSTSPAETTGKIPESGSLFDIEAKEPPAPAAEADPNPDDTAKPEPTPVEPDETPAETKPDPEPEDEPEAKTEPEPTPVEPDETPAETKPDPEPESTPVEPVETSADNEPPGADSDESLTGGAAISAAATAAAASAADDDSPVQADEPEVDEAEVDAAEVDAAEVDAAEVDEAEPEPEEKSEPEEKPKPASSGEAHTPKSDLDINESGSLFDL